MNERIELAKSWFKIADEDIITMKRAKQALAIAQEVRSRILGKLGL